MTNEADLAAVRRAYAKQVMFATGVPDPRIEAALASLRREDFLGPGPWTIPRLNRGKPAYEVTPDGDPVYLYQDVVVAISPPKGLNNGVPSFLAFLISLGRLREGETAVHIGAGVGYYTAVIASLVGPAGYVAAIEYEPDLAARAAANLSSFTNVRVLSGDGTTVPIDAADAIYVNAGAARPMNSWLDALKEGGRLILPLTAAAKSEHGPTATSGAVFLIERQGGNYLAQWKTGVTVYPCVGARDAESEAALAAAFEKGGEEKVTRLYRGTEIEEERCWVRGGDWALAYS